MLDPATWALLLGPEMRPRVDAAPSADAAPASALEAAAAAASAPAPAPASKPYHELFSLEMTQASVGPDGAAEVTDSLRLSEEVSAGPGGRVTVTERVESAHVEVLKPAAWPVLNEGDGGSDVHALHAAMELEGFYVGGAPPRLPAGGAACLPAWHFPHASLFTLCAAEQQGPLPPRLRRLTRPPPRPPAPAPAPVLQTRTCSGGSLGARRSRR